MTNRFLFTDRKVESLRHDSNKLQRFYDIHPRSPGLWLRVTKGGVKTFYCRYYVRGSKEEHNERLGRYPTTTVEQARSAALEKSALASRGEDPKKVQSVNRENDFWYQLNERSSLYRQHASTLRSGDKTVSSLKYHFRIWKGRRLDEITHEMVKRWYTTAIAEKKANGTPYTPARVNRPLAQLSGLFSLHVKTGLLDKNPVRYVRTSATREDTKQIRQLSQPEEARLRAALSSKDPWYQALIIMALHTGLRRGELYQLKWTDIDLIRAEIIVRGDIAKSKRTRTVPLSSELLIRLKTLHEEAAASPLVFPSPASKGQINTLKRSWKRLLSEAEITNFRFHDLRHSFASRLAANGVPLPTIKALMGHAKITTTERYLHATDESKVHAIANSFGAFQELDPRAQPILTTRP